MPVISIRVSNEWLAAVEQEMQDRLWSRNATVVNLVWRALSDAEKRLESKHLLEVCSNPGRGNRVGRPTSCPSCGGLNGMHQRGCDGKSLSAKNC
jgi:hypothetical protein